MILEKVRAIVKAIPYWVVSCHTGSVVEVECLLLSPRPKVLFRRSEGHKGDQSRIRIVPTWLRARDQGCQCDFPIHGKTEPISVGWSREPLAAAREINTRLLLPYLDAWRAGIRERDEYDKNRDLDRSLAVELASLVGARVSGERTERLYLPASVYAEITIWNQRADLKFANLPSDVAREIFQVLHRFKESV